MRFRSLNSSVAALSAAIVCAVAFLASPATAAQPAALSAQASSDTYVYWSYWDGEANGNWKSSTVGAGSVTPSDGDVIGWRFGAGEAPGISQPPRVSANFDEICKATPIQAGKKRVGLVVDYGTSAIAPSGQTVPTPSVICQTAAPTDTALQVTSTAVAVRTAPDTMVCGINNYPASGCGYPVAAAVATQDETLASSSPSASAQAESSGPGNNPTGIAIGVFVIVVLAIGALVMSRRKREV